MIASPLEAIEVIECGPPDRELELEAWQYLIDHHLIGHLQGYYQRNAYVLIANGDCTPPPQGGQR